MSNYKVGYSLLSNLNPKNPGFDVSANNLASSGIAIIGDNLKNLQDLSANLPSGNTNYFQVAVLGNFNNYGSSTDVSGISTGSYYTNNVSAMRIAADSSANRPTIASSLAGFIRYNTDINHLEYYNASTLSWSQLSKFQNQSNQITAVLTSGTGTITLLYTDPTGLNPSATTPYYNGYTVYIFKNTGATGASPAVFTLTPTPSASQPFGSNIDYLLVGGGGGGGAHQSPANAIDKAGAGGGAGGYISNTLTPVLGTTYTISVGSGGAGGTTVGSTFTTFYGGNGNNSSITTSGQNAGNFNGIVAYGGGGGACGYTNGPFFGNIGGSGGGGVASGFQPGFGGSPYGGDVSNNIQGAQGYAGGTGIFSSTSTTFIANNGSAGGGGAGGIGGNPSSSSTIINGGQGGIGLQNSIAGIASYYAAGGGGGGWTQSGAAGGFGGTGGSGIGGSGGNSGTPATIGTDASANTGSGGGGAGGSSTNPSSATSSVGGAGSAGICVFRFSTNNLSYLPPPTLKTATVTGGTAYSVYFTDQNGLNPSQIPYSNPVGYTVYIFLNSAVPGSASSLAYTFTPYFNDSSANVLVVGGGGGSGFSNGSGDGGGGGGGVLALTNYNIVANTPISLSVGCGGTVYTTLSVPGTPTSSQTTATGAQSTFGSYTLLGGGFGGVYNVYDPVSANNGAPGYSTTGPVPCANGGGSSGRSGSTTKTPGTGTAPPTSINGYINYYYGNSGGTGVTNLWDGAGGGGGAAGTGQNGVGSAVGGNATGGNGGLAYLSSISGYNIYYGGGGGGGTDISNTTGPSWTPANPGGYGGGATAKGASGGNGTGVFNTNQVYGGQPGINGTGQGGGGGNAIVDYVSSFYGFGGGGTVIIRYRSF